MDLSNIINQIKVFVLGPKESDSNMNYYQGSPPTQKRFGKGARVFKIGDLWFDTTDSRYLCHYWTENGWKTVEEVVDTDK